MISHHPASPEGRGTPFSRKVWEGLGMRGEFLSVIYDAS